MNYLFMHIGKYNKYENQLNNLFRKSAKGESDFAEMLLRYFSLFEIFYFHK